MTGQSRPQDAPGFRPMTQAANIKTDAVPHGSPYPANEIPGLVWGFRFVAGVPVPIRENSALDVQRHEWVWLHFSLADMRVQSWLAASNLVPKADLDHFLSKDDTQRLFSTGSCVAGAFFDLVHGFGHAEDEFGHLRFIMTDHLLITGRRRALASVETVRLSVASGRSFDSPVTLLNTLVEEIATSIDRIAEELSAEIDVVEDMVVKDMLPDDRQRLGRARLMSVRIHRRLNALRGLFRRIDAKEGGPMEALRAAGSRLVHRLDDLDHEVIELRDRAHLPGGAEHQARRADQPPAPHPVDPHGAPAAAEPDRRAVRDECHRPALCELGQRVLVGDRAGGRRLGDRAVGPETRRHPQMTAGLTHTPSHEHAVAHREKNRLDAIVLAGDLFVERADGSGIGILDPPVGDLAGP